MCFLPLSLFIRLNCKFRPTYWIMPVPWKKDRGNTVFLEENRFVGSGFPTIPTFKQVIVNYLRLKLVDEMVYDAIIDRFFGVHPVIPVKILEDLFHFFTAII